MTTAEGSALAPTGLPSSQSRSPKTKILDERRDKVLHLYNEGLSNASIAKTLNVDRSIVQRDLKHLAKNPTSGVVYNKRPPREEQKWYKIIKRTGQELEWYRRKNLYPPLLRKMYYRLFELGVIAKTKGNYQSFASMTAEARRGIDSTFTKISHLPKLPLDCFRDDKKVVLGEIDIDIYPREPQPTEPPEDPEEYIENAIQRLKSAPKNYDGQCSGGSDGRNPGYWYMQPNYVEIWVESVGLQKDLISFQGERKVKVVANGGFASTDYTARNCQRLKYMVDNHEHIKQVVILYFGDLDSSGDFMDGWLGRALEFYGVRNFKVVRVAITPEQLIKYNLITDPEKTKKGRNKDPRFPRFKAKYPQLVKKYGEKFGVQLEAFQTTDERLKVFKQLVQNAIDEYWDADIFYKNCPPKNYDYKARGEEEPENIDPDDVRPMMYQRITEAFKLGWQKDFVNSMCSSTNDDGPGEGGG